LLTGPLPGSFGNLLELKHLFLYDCALSGVLPSSLSNLVQLKSLWLADNLFVGEIDFGALTNLNSLVIGNNYFNSFASSFENLTQLSYVDMRHNFFGGRVPEFLGACSSLTNFNGGFNGFTGSLPNSFGDLALLQSLNLESNYINGFFPASWARMTSLDQLWLNNNSLEGSLFPLNFLSKLTLLVLSFNSLSGAIADTTSSESNLQVAIFCLARVIINSSFSFCYSIFTWTTTCFRSFLNQLDDLFTFAFLFCTTISSQARCRRPSALWP
jgi:hypothetical protein